MPVTSPSLLTPFLTGGQVTIVIGVPNVPTNLDLDPNIRTLVTAEPTTTLTVHAHTTTLLLDG